MDSYDSKENTNEALDFTSSSKKKFNEAPVLDLSCKKSPSNHGISYSLSPSPSENRSLSPSSDSNAEHHHHHHGHENQSRHSLNTSGYMNDDEKNSYEERSYIVTPPPDNDSPRKLKYNNNYSGLTEEQMMHCYAMSQMNIPVQVASIIPPSLAAQNGGTVRQMNVSATATSSSSSSSSSSTTVSHSDLALMEQSRKAPRPFKAYPKDPLSLSMGPELIYNQQSNEQYTEFRKRMLESVRRTNEGTNIKMRRTSKSPVLPTSTMDEKDAAYWERRRKNNEAAKRSRDARRAKEDEIAIRAAFLEQENLKLKYELVTLRQEHAKLRCLAYSN